MSNLNCITYIKFSRFFGDLSIYLVICCLPKEENVVIRLPLFYETHLRILICFSYSKNAHCTTRLGPWAFSLSRTKWQQVDSSGV